MDSLIIKIKFEIKNLNNLIQLSKQYTIIMKFILPLGVVKYEPQKFKIKRIFRYRIQIMALPTKKQILKY